MNGKLRIFIVHGRNNEVLAALLHWLEQRGVFVEAITFEELAVPGQTIPSELERIATLGDAAIVLATPDDAGRLQTNLAESPRARQNVWLELGWFWARLGRNRTLLLLKGDVELPSDTQGILFLRYQQSLREISRQLQRFLDSLKSSEPDSLTEVVHVATHTHTRSWEYQRVYESAQNSVVITGIGMINLRQHLPEIFHQMSTTRPNLRLDLVILSEQFVSEHEEIIEKAYRPNLKQDIGLLHRDISTLLKEYSHLQNRVRLFRYNGIMTFSATVADPPEWGSLMLVETILPRGDFHLVARPRLMLRRRCMNGLYDRYWGTIDAMRMDNRLIHILDGDVEEL